MNPSPAAAPTVLFDAAFAAVGKLCDHFDADRDAVMAPAYKEQEARDQFITPFFEALGWDVRNVAHRSVYEKDVVIEQRANIAGHIRSADYAFRRPGTHLTAFFVEAKKPSVDIRNHADCYQAVLYGWNANTPLVVLTDFEQLFILDARSEPDLGSAARLVLKAHGSFTYRDYRDPEKFTELWGLLARENVAAGSLDKAAAALPRLSGRIHKDDLFARGSGPVDETFLAQMEVWREKLAKSLKRSNHDLDGERLTSLTQRILDRLVFLRFLEDRGIEKDVTFAAIGHGGSAWADFLKVSRRLDDRYNGIIYKKDPDGCESPALAVDEGMFAAIADRFAPQNSKYLFNEISVTILGSIYERFLGNVIVARDKTAIVDAKPEVRKAGGVYYTPDYIVPAGKSSFPLIVANAGDPAITPLRQDLIEPEKCLADKHVLITPAMAASSGLIDRIQKLGKPLGSLADVNFGKQLRDRKKFLNDVISVPDSSEIPLTHVACVTGKDVHHYALTWGHLACLNDRVAQSGGCWDDRKHETKSKLLTRQIGKHPSFACDEIGYHCLNTIFMVTSTDGRYSVKYLLGILNSRLLAYYWEQRFFDQRQTFPKIKGTYLKQLPIRPVDFAKSVDTAQHERLAALVDKLLAAMKTQAARSGDKAEYWRQTAAALDRQINALVYELYGLTDEEIALVEGNA